MVMCLPVRVFCMALSFVISGFCLRLRLGQCTHDTDFIVLAPPPRLMKQRGRFDCTFDAREKVGYTLRTSPSSLRSCSANGLTSEVLFRGTILSKDAGVPFPRCKDHQHSCRIGPSRLR